MLSIAAVGLVSFSALIFLIGNLLRQLGATDVAKGLIGFTGVAIIAALAMTYLPALLLP
ncbi:MAG: hypothetical protein AAGJ87_06865 [Pseudomonadota bacterium]